MAEEITKKYVAFSEDALSEQITKLTETVNQQANTIQNLSTAIAHLSAERCRPGSLGMTGQDQFRFGSFSTDTAAAAAAAAAAAGHRPTGNGLAAAPSQQSVKKERHHVAGAPAPRPNDTKSSAVHSKRQIGNGHAGPSAKKQKDSGFQILPAQDDEEPSSSLEETVQEIFHAPVVAQNFDEDETQNAKNTLLTQLVALRDTCPFALRFNVVKPRVCHDSIAIRTEELLSRLRAAGMEIGSRKDFMDSVMAIGPGIQRGRSVKFGRDTRRALAIPRAHFSRDELDIIDKGYLPEHNSEKGGQLFSDEIEEDAGLDDE